jgi:hypothetical protein
MHKAIMAVGCVGAIALGTLVPAKAQYYPPPDYGPPPGYGYNYAPPPTLRLLPRGGPERVPTGL